GWDVESPRNLSKRHDTWPAAVSSSPLAVRRGVTAIHHLIRVPTVGSSDLSNMQTPHVWRLGARRPPSCRLGERPTEGDAHQALVPGLHRVEIGHGDSGKEFSNRHGLNFGRWPFDAAARRLESTPSGRALDSTVLPAVARP